MRKGLMLTSPRGIGRAALVSLAVSAAVLCTSTIGVRAADRPLVIARDMDINSLDPHRSWCDTCQIFDTSVYEHLTTLDKDNKLVPLLAASWISNKDQTEFTFKLDPAAKFSDGSAVEAKDVKWSFERLKNLKQSSSYLTDTIEQIDTPDARTVVIKLNIPNSEFPQIVAAPTMAILNSDLVAEHGGLADATAADKDGAEQWLMTNSAGSGPFILEKYEPNAELRLKRNDNYWGTKAPAPEVVFRQVKDAVAQAQMLQSGTVDVAMQIDPDTAKTLEGTDVKVERVASFNFVYVAIAPGAKANKVKLSPEVREAISLAIDRKGLIDVTLGGAGRELGAPIPLGFPGGEGQEIPAYDPAKAKELLAKAGLADGFTLDSTYPAMNVYGVDLNLMMQKVQQDLSKVGIKVELSPVPFANWREKVNGDHTGLTAVFFAPDFFGTSQYVDYFGLGETSVWAKRAGADNDPSIRNAKIDDVRKAALAAPTPEEATKKWFEAGQMMAKDRIILPMVSPDLILAYGSSVKGVRYSACCNLPLSEISY
ncbi:ABC transporter substrate-binding protein [Dongia sedimenti]|uniref:ABC transporter substrate-binding protein n=1 Tax=Dongia sedimenti TaxID=3064282 RepID=A0ABU0YS13_9PROT|nr:ABC transporter substrate-binding protein [Rhodospirillaceae bacterium R-7]